MAAKRTRGRETVGDMVRSMGLVLVVVAVMILLTFRLSPRDPVQTVELGPAVAEARQTAPYGVLVPRGLGEDWLPVSASTRVDAGATTWRIGWITPAEDFAAVGQSDRPAADFVDAFAAGGPAAGEALIDGQRWARLGDPQAEERSLVRTASATRAPGAAATTTTTATATTTTRAPGAADAARDKAVTVVVTGTAAFAELEELAASLAPA